jgi:hypothetical protein
MILTADGRVSGIDTGIILLDNHLPRPIGDIGNARTFGYPVAYDVCQGAGTALVVENGAAGLLDEVVATGLRLRDLGVRAIATCCGFLAIYQHELAERLDVPVASSSLLQVPTVLRMLAPDVKVCILTVNAATLTDEHLAAVGIQDRNRITMAGLQNTEHFYPMILGKRPELDVEVAQREVVDTALAAVHDDPDIGAFVFECTNLPPYSAAVRAATSRPVWDALTLINWLNAGVAT